MKNNTDNIGKRIKEVRLLRKLTQSKLCGTELTRNHLSLIESGRSLPSLKNICYIADRLDVPVGYFFSGEGNDDAKFASYIAIDNIKKSYFKRDYITCIELCRQIPDTLRSDEINMLYVRSLYYASLSSAEKLDLDNAYSLMESAREAAASCPYVLSEFAKAADYYKTLFRNITETSLPAVLYDIKQISSYVPAELVLYMKLIATDNVADELFSSARHKQHAEAIRNINEGNVRLAFNLLLELSEFSSLPYYMRFYVYDHLEKCANEIGEFKHAYNAAKKKLEILGK